jgi:general transcription factor 3C polypeptide 5 (transcription factor C subunit 1)
VSLRPDDPFAKRLLSTAVTTNNLLLKVTVPKRTGRKRRRGSPGPFLTDAELETTSNGLPPRVHETHVDASTIYRSLQDNASTYKLSVAGMVDETHRFRSKSPINNGQSPSDHSAMPDLQYSAANNDAMVGLRDHVLPMRCRCLPQ